MKHLLPSIIKLTRGMNYLQIISILIFAIGCNQKQTKEKESSPMENLTEGNKRFVSGNTIHPDGTLEKIKSLKNGQFPFAVVVGCSDSRVPPEFVFDQGLGDLFVVRTAGNIIGDYELGSIEYAIEHFHCKLIVVLGHENCGAIEALIGQGAGKTHDHIESIIEYLKNETEEKELSDSLKTNIVYAVRANVLHGIHLLKSSEPVLSQLVDKKELEIVGAVYDLDNGKVEIIK